MRWSGVTLWEGKSGKVRSRRVGLIIMVERCNMRGSLTMETTDEPSFGADDAGKSDVLFSIRMDVLYSACGGVDERDFFL
ncbi:hypothetical protein Tco_0373745 [Tanacetum coccineum]